MFISLLWIICCCICDMNRFIFSHHIGLNTCKDTSFAATSFPQLPQFSRFFTEGSGFQSKRTSNLYTPPSSSCITIMKASTPLRLNFNACCWVNLGSWLHAGNPLLSAQLGLHMKGETNPPCLEGCFSIFSGWSVSICVQNIQCIKKGCIWTRKLVHVETLWEFLSQWCEEWWPSAFQMNLRLVMGIQIIQQCYTNESTHLSHFADFPAVAYYISAALYHAVSHG